MSLIKEMREFFESYELVNELTEVSNIKVEIFEAVSKNILQVKVIESKKLIRRIDKNMFCDVKVEKNTIKMNFKYKEMKFSKEFLDVVKSIKKNDYTLKAIGNQLTIVIIEPRLDEVSKIFTLLEPYCKRF